MKLKRLDRSIWGLLGYQFLEYWYYYILAIGALFGTHYIQSYLPFLAKELVEMVDGIGGVETWKFFALALGIIVFRTASRLLFFYPARILQKDLRVELLARLESATPCRYKEYPAGQLFQMLSNDMEQIRALVGFALLQLGNMIVAMVVLIPKIIDFNPRLIVAFLPLIVAFALFTIIVSRNKNYYKKVQDLQGEVQNIVMESYVGKRTIKNYHAESSFIDLFQKTSYSELWNFYKAGIGVAISMPLNPLGLGLSFLWGAYIIQTEGLGMSSLVLLSGFIFLFQEPLMFVSWIGVVFTRTHASWKRVKGLIKNLEQSSERELSLLENNSEIIGGRGTDLNFQLEFWEKPLKLNFERGEWSVIIGKTGDGKTHLIGQIAEVLQMANSKLSYVAQSPYLYNDTIEGNIFLGQEVTESRKEEAYQLLLLFGLDYLASGKDNLLKMEVGENGKRLSGGQAKRLCLVRSLMSEARVLLWDDPFSSVDVILEKQIISELRTKDIFKNKTLILSSHRVSTVKLCDSVTFIEKDNGIIESGSVEDLFKNKTKTYEYFENQMV